MKRLKLLVILAIIFTVFYIDTTEGFCMEGRIHKNIFINDIDVSKMTKKEGIERLNLYLQKNRYIELKCEEKIIKVDKNQLGVSYDVDEAIEEAYSIGRDEDIISNMKRIIALNRGNKEVILLKCTYDIDKIEDFIDEFYKSIYKKPIDATIKITDSKIVVTEDSYGRKIDKSKLKEVLLDNIAKFDSSKNEIFIETIEPKYTYEELKKVNTLLGSYETSFGLKNKNRVNNITAAADINNNLIIKSGEIFSFNQNISKARDILKEAPIIVNGKTETGIGGGICQVSTTIYNAALYAGLEIIDITNHSIPSLYIEKGRDATVSQGSIDFKFKNNSEAPIFMCNKVVGNTVITEIYGNNDFKKDIEIVTKIIKVINNNTVYKPDISVQKGQQIIEQKGRLGYRVKTFRIYKNNQGIVKNELINTSYYPPGDEVILTEIKKNRETY